MLRNKLKVWGGENQIFCLRRQYYYLGSFGFKPTQHIVSAPTMWHSPNHIYHLWYVLFFFLFFNKSYDIYLCYHRSRALIYYSLTQQSKTQENDNPAVYIYIFIYLIKSNILIICKCNQSWNMYEWLPVATTYNRIIERWNVRSRSHFL